ncbi:MAG: SPOR domain-containing protein [Betaproteobacteria bacterium]
MTHLPAFLSRQRGGTLLGFVIGTLFGLAVSLAVAVYVTKAPIPFMNKNQPRPAEGEAAEGKKNKDWDPNAGLPGRLPPKPEAGASAPAEAPAPAVPPAAGAASPAASAPLATPAPKSADALGDLARSRSEAAKPAEPAPRPAAAEAPAADPFQYFVQVGAFRNPEEAEQLRAKLLLQGMQAKISEREQGGRVVHRVRLGPFERRDEADKARERLEGGGTSAVVVRVQR